MRLRKILALGLPIIGAMASQNVLNLIDTAMIGHLGEAALAAVGISNFANFMAMAFITGLAAGVQAIASRRKGEGRDMEMAIPLNGGLLLVVALAIPWTLFLYFYTPKLFPYLNKDPEVIRLGVPYLQMRLFGIAAIGMNFSFRGYFNGVHRSMLYLRTLLVMNASNIVLNYGLIFGKFGLPELGVTGAGIGSAVASYIGCGTYTLLGWIYARHSGFLRRLPDYSTFRSMLKLALPSGLQQLFFATGLTALLWIIGKVGTSSLAAANVLINIAMVAILPALGFGLAAASLVGESLGKGDQTDARRWGWDVVKVACVCIGILCTPMLFIPTQILSIFFKHPDAVSLSLAKFPLQLTGATMWLDVIGMVLLNALLGAGDSRRVMFISIGLQWGFFLPIAWILGPHLGYGLFAIWMLQGVYRGIQSGIFSLIWQGQQWTRINV